MSVIVSQSLPWSQDQLRLSDTSRWTKLVPLIRPSVTVSRFEKAKVLLDTAQAAKKQVQVVVVSDAEHVAEAFLSGNQVAACVVDESGETASAEVVRLVAEQGVGMERGVVIVKTGKESRLEALEVSKGLLGKEGGAFEVTVNGDAERGHVVGLLDGVNEKERQSIASVTELLKHFIRTSKSTTTVFHSQKIGEKLAIVHSGQHEEFETAKQAVEKDLTKLLKEHARTVHDGLPMTYSVHCADINGLSRLESWVLSYEVSRFLDAQSIPHYLTTSSIIQPSLDSRGYTLSLCPVLQSILPPTTKPSNPLSSPAAGKPTSSNGSQAKTTPFTDSDIRKRLTSGCNALIASEPLITEYDTIVGDGDCGLTLRSGAQKVLSFTSDLDLSQLPQILSQLVDELEVTMGGTSGALYCIFLSSLSQSLANIKTAAEFPAALHASLTHLLNFTSARLGDRTMLDALIPFVDTLKETNGDYEKALEEARKGVEKTKVLEAKLGRSTYLDEKATRGVPDPGAVGVLVLLEGLCLAKKD